MLPVLLSIGSLSISSFGFFLALGFVAAIFVCFRLSRAYELDAEKILDVAILTFLLGLLGARIIFVITNWSYFTSFDQMILFNRYPGLSFWGGFLGGVLALGLFGIRSKIPFAKLADFSATSFAIGIFFGNIGCFLGGCGYGKVSTLFFATPVVGLIGKRFPVSLLEAVLFLWVFLYLFKMVIRFHFDGKIAAVFLMLTGLIKLFSEYFRGDQRFIFNWYFVSFGQILSFTLFIIGVVMFYRYSKRNFKIDILDFIEQISSGKGRLLILLRFKKNCYNFWITWQLRFSSLPKTVKRRLNVRKTPKDVK